MRDDRIDLSYSGTCLGNEKCYNLTQNICMIFENNINFVIAGEAGQGIETAANVLSKILFEAGYYTFSAFEYMSRIRGGSNSVLIKISSQNAPFYSEKIDVLFSMNKKSFEHLKNRISENTITIETDKNNFFVIGYILGLLKLDKEAFFAKLKNNFPEITEMPQNQETLNLGYSQGVDNQDIEIKIPANCNFQERHLTTGNDALALGCAAGGCNFISFYPMSPSTNVSTILTQMGEEFNIISEQVEDEICAINMALGASYAGARAMVSTAGGGFALMTEGVSLAGMIESPIVIHIAQRPAPATGLPTRTAQEDLNLAMYAGHGEFPRIIFSPSSLQDSFQIGRLSFNLADKFQVPVFILTEQYLLESIFSLEKFDYKLFNFGQKNEYYVVESAEDYKRYQLSESGISNRAVPNYGKGLVCVDSDEHDELGYITEDASVRKNMVEKRLKKMDLIKQEMSKLDISKPIFKGNEDYKNLIISWGGSFHAIENVIKDRPDFALLHFRQVYPISEEILKYTEKTEKTIIIEQNATGQFAMLLNREFGLNFDYKYLKYDGNPFSVEEIKFFLEVVK